MSRIQTNKYLKNTKKKPKITNSSQAVKNTLNHSEEEKKQEEFSKQL